MNIKMFVVRELAKNKKTQRNLIVTWRYDSGSDIDFRMEHQLSLPQELIWPKPDVEDKERKVGMPKASTVVQR